MDVAGPVSPVLDFPPATPEGLEETGRLVTGAGGRWVEHVADQRDIAALRSVLADVEGAWGGVDVVFANAGIQGFRLILEMEDAD